MLSRVAEALYWVGRYVERASNVARYADVNRYLTLDLPSAGDSWTPLVEITGDLAAFLSRYPQADAHHALQFLAIDEAHPGSILSCLRRARENARAARDTIPLAVWQQLHGAYTIAETARASGDVGFAFFDDIKRAALTFSGLMHDSMAHSEGWRFWRLGQQLERADQTSRLLDVKYFLLLPSVQDVGSPLDELQWAALLKSADADDMYRRLHGRFTPDRIVEFLLLDREFPRAVQACLITADDTLHAISGTPSGTFRHPAEQRLGQLRSRLAFTRASDIVLHGFHDFIDGLQAELNGVHQGIDDVYFAAALPSAAAGQQPDQQQ